MRRCGALAGAVGTVNSHDVLPKAMPPSTRSAGNRQVKLSITHNFRPDHPGA